MNLIDEIQPISYLERHATDLAKRINQIRQPVMITIDGVVQMVIQDQQSYQQQIETIALLKVLAMSQQAIAGGKVSTAEQVFASRKRK